MKIIRTFLSIDAVNFPSLEGVEVVKNELRVKPGVDFGTVTYPLVYPRLAINFFGFQINPSAFEEIVEVGVWGTHEGETGYFSFESGKWSLANSPVYCSIEQMRVAIAQWMGAVKFILKLGEGARIKELSFGYEVDIEITEYLLRFGVPKYLSRDYRLTFVALSNNLGEVRLPDGFTSDSIKELQVQILGELPKPASLCNGTIHPTNPTPNRELQVIFKISPLVEFSRGLYQIEHIPSIIIRELPVQNYMSMYRNDSIQTGDNTVEIDSPSAVFDMPLELLVMTPTMAASKAITKQIMENIKKDGKVYIPPIDLSVGCLVLGSREPNSISFEGGEGNDPVNDIKGNLATMVIKICLKRVDF